MVIDGPLIDALSTHFYMFEVQSVALVLNSAPSTNKELDPP